MNFQKRNTYSRFAREAISLSTVIIHIYILLKEKSDIRGDVHFFFKHEILGERKKRIFHQGVGT